MTDCVLFSKENYDSIMSHLKSQFPQRFSASAGIFVKIFTKFKNST